MDMYQTNEPVNDFVDWATRGHEEEMDESLNLDPEDIPKADDREEDVYSDLLEDVEELYENVPKEIPRFDQD